jgi:nitrate reductase NapD
MSIYSLVVHTKPENIESVTNALKVMEAVDVHGINEKGKIVVSLDHPDRNYCSDTIMSFHDIPGVLNSSLIYEYFEDENADDTDEAEESRQTTTSQTTTKEVS